MDKHGYPTIPKPFRLKDGPHTLFKGTRSECMSKMAKLGGHQNGMRVVKNNHGFRKEVTAGGTD